MKFSEFGLNEALLEGLDAMGFEKATPVQEKAIPIILDGKDIIACAQTGTGKTAAFLLPTLHHLTNRNTPSIDALILVPTRELAIQIDRELEGFGYFTGTSSIPIYGGRDGKSFEQEKKALTTGANIIIATPGRLIAHLNLGYVKMKDLKFLILDEADRMLDMGFVNDIEKIISFLPKKRQNLMFSATMPQKIRKFAKGILHNPEQIRLAVSQPAEGIMQGAYEVADEHKLALIKHKLKDRQAEGQIIIFASTKSKVKDIASGLKSIGMPVNEMHSDFDQAHREEVLRQFKNGQLQVLVATDILSRGIDVKGISLVVNYDVPSDPEDYIHRIGRTARAETEGVAITLINRKDRRKFQNIEKLMKRDVRKMPLPDFLVERQAKSDSRPFDNSNRGRGGRGRNNWRSKNNKRGNFNKGSGRRKPNSSN